MTKPTHEAHPIAELFPMLDDDEIAALAHDIKQNGLRLPIVLDAEGRVLDGRNRLAACTKAKVTPEFVTFDGDAPELFVISANVHRRHMTIGQRAMITAIALHSAGKRQRGRWTRGSVPHTSGSGSSGWAQRMAEAGMVLDADRDLAGEVAAGWVLLSRALDKVRRRSESKAVDVKVERHEPNVIRADRLVKSEDEQERLEDVTSQLEDGVEQLEEKVETLEELLSGVAADIAPAIGAKAPAKKVRRGDDLSPVQRREKRAAREAADEQAIGEIHNLLVLIARTDAELHDVGLAKLSGKPQRVLTEELDRFAKTVGWALSVLRREGGE